MKILVIITCLSFSFSFFSFLFLDLSSNSSTCNYTMAQNNNHIIQENNHVNGRINDSNQQSIKYRAERTLTFENVLIGDSTLKYLDPARFDIERKTYIKTMVKKLFLQKRFTLFI